MHTIFGIETLEVYTSFRIENHGSVYYLPSRSNPESRFLWSNLLGDTWFIAKGWKLDNEGISVLAKRIRTMLSHYWRENSSTTTHPEWFLKIQRTQRLLEGVESAADADEEPVGSVPQRRARAKEAPKAVPKSKAEPKRKAAAKSDSKPPKPAAKAAPRVARASENLDKGNQPPAKIQRVQEPPHETVVQTPADIALTVQIPPSRFDFFETSTEEEEEEVEHPDLNSCQETPQPLKPMFTPEKDSAMSSDEPTVVSKVLGIPDSSFLDSAPQSPSVLDVCAHSDVSAQPSVSARPETDTEIEENTPTMFVKEDKVQVGWNNRKGGWIRFLEAPYPKLKYWTSVLEESEGQVWGVWTVNKQKIHGVVPGIQPAEIPAAMAAICQKYVKGLRQGCARRPPIFKGLLTSEEERINAFADVL